MCRALPKSHLRSNPSRLSSCTHTPPVTSEFVTTVGVTLPIYNKTHFSSSYAHCWIESDSHVFVQSVLFPYKKTIKCVPNLIHTMQNYKIVLIDIGYFKYSYCQDFPAGSSCCMQLLAGFSGRICSFWQGFYNRDFSGFRE